ncbi:MAG: hypothetical protein KF847_15970 [Pirellulales bacterium]|nr:hypothetical protein [Pirellulales bacterium]
MSTTSLTVAHDHSGRGADRSLAPTRSEVNAPERTQPTAGSAVRSALLANALYVFNTLLRSGMTLLLMPVLVGLLGREQFALWVAVNTITMYLSLSEAGLGQSVVNAIGAAYARNDLRRIGEIMSTAHVLYWLLVVPTALAALACYAWLPVGKWLLAERDVHNAPLLTTCLAAATVFALARIPLLVFTGMLSGICRLPLRLACESAATAACACATVATAWLGVGLLGVTVAANAALLAAALVVAGVASYGRPWARLGRDLVRRELAWPLAKNSSCFFVINASTVLDRSVLTLMAAKMGGLALAPPVFFLLNVFRVAAWSFITAGSRAIQPYVLIWHARGENEKTAAVTALMIKTTSVAAAIFAVLFVPLVEPILAVWLGPDSYPGAGCVALIAGAFLLDAAFAAPTSLLVVMNNHRRLAAATALKATLVVALSAAGGVLYADPLIGLSSGLLLATVLGNIPFIPLAARMTGITTAGFVRKLLVPPTALSAVALAAGTLLTNWPQPLARAAAALAISLGLVAVAWLQLFDDNERQLCRYALERLVGRRPLAPTMT